MDPQSLRKMQKLAGIPLFEDQDQYPDQSSGSQQPQNRPTSLDTGSLKQIIHSLVEFLEQDSTRGIAGLLTNVLHSHYPDEKEAIQILDTGNGNFRLVYTGNNSHTYANACKTISEIGGAMRNMDKSHTFTWEAETKSPYKISHDFRIQHAEHERYNRNGGVYTKDRMYGGGV